MPFVPLQDNVDQLRLLDVYEFAKYKYNLKENMPLKDAVQVIASKLSIAIELPLSTSSILLGATGSSYTFNSVYTNEVVQAPSAAAIDPSTIGTGSGSSGLSGTCLNKLCLMMEYAMVMITKTMFFY